MHSRAITLLLTLAFALPTLAQQQSSVSRDIDPAIARVITTTPAIDNHAHPMLSPPDDAADRNFDALPVDNMAPETDPVAWRADWPAQHDAWLALYGVDLQAPLTPAAQQQLDAARARVKAREGAHYSQYILDKANIGTMVANRVSMGTGVQPPRFRWVPYDDALLFPFDTSAIADTPDRAQFFPLEAKVFAAYMKRFGLTKLPPTLTDYIFSLVLPTLAYQKSGGAVAIKFELAYLRLLDIGKPTREQATAVYAKGIAGATLSPADYKLLQDYLFHDIARECGVLGLAIHFHGMSGGGRYFSIAGVNPLNLEPLLNDASLKDTNFVLLHGGWPFVHEAGAMLQKPNFYLDISQQALSIPARTLSTWLREWLELYPEKVLFGTDGYPFSSTLGWEESTWLAARNAREALGLALTGMQRDGEITSARAAQLAHMVLHDNAAALYHLNQ
jgi:predicted TIM-barrel fold metal-dependent hydrolase